MQERAEDPGRVDQKNLQVCREMEKENLVACRDLHDNPGNPCCPVFTG